MHCQCRSCSRLAAALLSTHVGRQGVDISVTVCLCIFVHVFELLRISLARIKLAASNFTRWFRGVLGRESPFLGNFASQEAQNRRNPSAVASIADRRQSPPLTSRALSVEATGVYRQYLPSACVDKCLSPKTDVLVYIFPLQKSIQFLRICGP